MERETPKLNLADLSFTLGDEALRRLAKALGLIDGGI